MHVYCIDFTQSEIEYHGFDDKMWIINNNVIMTDSDHSVNFTK